MLSMKKFIFCFFIIFIASFSSAEESKKCEKKFQKLLELPKKRVNTEESNFQRLDATIRYQSENILRDSIPPDKSQTFLNSQFGVYFTNYQSKIKKNKIDIVFTKEAAIVAYRLTQSGKTQFGCGFTPFDKEKL